MREYFSSKCCCVAFSMCALTLVAVEGNAQPASAVDAAATANWTTVQDHQNMMAQLGITKLRPGPSGRAGAPNGANYDPEKANPYPNLPDPLVLKDGRRVTR